MTIYKEVFNAEGSKYGILNDLELLNEKELINYFKIKSLNWILSLKKDLQIFYKKDRIILSIYLRYNPLKNDYSLYISKRIKGEYKFKIKIYEVFKNHYKAISLIKLYINQFKINLDH